MQSNPEFSIVIVNYQSKALLEALLGSFRRYFSPESYEVIIVNNDQRESIGNFNSPNIHCIQNSHNLGFGAACNIGACSARGKILGFINPDIQIFSDILTEISQRFKENDLIGALSPQIRSTDGSVQAWSAGSERTFIDLLLNNLGYARSKKIWSNQKTCLVSWISGGAMFIPREFFLRLSGFDEQFFLYYEDIDLCRRIINNGQQVVLEPSIIVGHIGGQSHDSLSSQKMYYYQSQLQYFQKYYPGLISALVGILTRFTRNV